MWSLLLLASTVWSFAHLPIGLSDRNKMVLWPGCEGRARCSLHKKNVRSVRVVLKMEWMLLQPLCRRSVECAIHHERDAREEQYHISMWHEQAIIVIMACDLYCCLLPQCEALRTCRSGFPIATIANIDRRPIYALSIMISGVHFQN